MKHLSIAFFLIATTLFLLSCGGGMPKAHYQPKRYHQSKKYYSKVNDATIDNKNKKAGNKASAARYKNKQAAYLKNLNRSKNPNQNDGIFYLY